jgi:hypothetical protein
MSHSQRGFSPVVKEACSMPEAFQIKIGGGQIHDGRPSCLLAKAAV